MPTSGGQRHRGELEPCGRGLVVTCSSLELVMSDMYSGVTFPGREELAQVNEISRAAFPWTVGSADVGVTGRSGCRCKAWRATSREEATIARSCVWSKR
jgi:hypothetical protein